ncbi:MAG: hypothetical protein EAX86_04625 [Candidatus Heimdallarchaeota archaeon]|nr:hypothetical protein [Candidatus Heimdallarchaeota archaeon]
MAVKIPLLILLGLSSILAMSAIVTIETNYSTRLIQGEDCSTYHNDLFINLYSNLERLGVEKDNGILSIIFSPAAPELIFTADVILQRIPEASQLIQDNITYNFSPFVYPEERIATWNFTRLNQADGEFSADIILSVKVPDNYRIHPGYEATYAIELRHTLEPRELSIYEYIFSFQWFDINLTNQLLSYLSYLFIAFVAILGMPRLNALIEISTNKKISKKTLQQYHYKAGKFSGIVISLHVILSIISPMWLNILKLWILPTGYVPTNIEKVLTFQDSNFGLELGRWAGLLLLYTFISGVNFGWITRKIGRNWALSLQQLSYLSLFMIAIHALIIGTLARDISLFTVFIWSVLIMVFSLRLILFWFNRELKNQRQLTEVPSNF